MCIYNFKNFADVISPDPHKKERGNKGKGKGGKMEGGQDWGLFLPYILGIGCPWAQCLSSMLRNEATWSMFGSDVSIKSNFGNIRHFCYF
jgi:hypothetical protein